MLFYGIKLLNKSSLTSGLSLARISTSSTYYSRLSAAALVDSAPTKAQPYLRLMRLDKPIGTWLLFWPCTWSIGLAAPAGHLPDLKMLVLFGTGAVMMRGAGCVVNDLWDKDFDKKVERTKSRPLASGELRPKQALVLLTGLLSSSLAVLLQMNRLTVGIGASSLLLVFSYPFFKRITNWPQAVLGLTFNYGAIMGFTAASGHFCPIVVPLYIAGWCWTMSYDTIYAHQDKSDDSLIGVKSTALLFGDNTKKYLTAFSTGMIANLAVLGAMTNQTLPYYVGVSAIGAHLGHQIYTLDINNGSDCWNKFRSNNWIGAILFGAIVASNLMKEEKKKEHIKEVDGEVI
ncbi:unnamed protein product [Bursaphelenchus okinawaensis]|uniref:4-hydroxybenzoate polyprenyltransferase, mitochondrial n=1 Tax=Bursaphelenchus okinawaensis TaxID=465554 RepID=A0A811KHB5_9BILA|nr:unnamed protein product [Bursaphelenchus okinawaensis]CAG9103143.1 unnamed protein product [Bursaphelenchus okinawaensis]